jgi:asparagine synthase (glutamine-hydrolysing)
MCGIAGLIFSERSPDAGPLITRMTQSLHHRGPDDGAAVLFGGHGASVVQRPLGARNETVEWGRFDATLALGARRLAVIDRSDAGRQPMSASGGQAWIVFNGEIYNYVELREELAARGMTFTGRGDTEVALAAYRAWGADCFSRFRGMWALAVVDWVAGRVVLSRDRLGIKPLYLAGFERGYAFASEIKSLLLLPGVSRDVNEARLRDFLIDGLLDHTNDTLFEDVWSFEPGCWLEIDLRPPTLTAPLGRLHRYWPDVNEPRAPARESFRAGSASRRFAVANDRFARAGGAARRSLALPARIEEAVRLHLRSDAAVGSCLSGGLDSSAIVTTLYAMGEAIADTRWSQHTFSAVLPGHDLDESRYVEAVHAACPGLRGHAVEPRPEQLLADLDALIWHQEEPFASPSIFMQWQVMRLARQHGVTVLLDGQGGDELFCGYPGYYSPYLASLVARLRWRQAAREFFAAPLRRHYSRTALAAHSAGHLLPSTVRDLLRRNRNRRVCDHLHPDLLDAEETILPPYQQRIPRASIRAGSASRRFAVANDRSAGARIPSRTPAFVRGRFDRFCWDMLLHHSLPALLHYEDRNAMAFSIEARVPLLDAPLVEWAMALPPHDKLRNGRTKAALREALVGRVPEIILARDDKIGFAAPTAEWLAGPLRTWWRDLFVSRSFAERGCFHLPGVQRLADRFDRGDHRAALPLWRAAIVEHWARRLLDRPDVSTP